MGTGVSLDEHIFVPVLHGGYERSAVFGTRRRVGARRGRCCMSQARRLRVRHGCWGRPGMPRALASLSHVPRPHALHIHHCAQPNQRWAERRARRDVGPPARNARQARPDRTSAAVQVDTPSPSPSSSLVKLFACLSYLSTLSPAIACCRTAQASRCQCRKILILRHDWRTQLRGTIGCQL